MGVKMRNNVKGGSIASSRVNSLVVNETLPKPKMIKNEITPKFIENNYGIEFKTTGGKKKSKNKKKGGSIASSRVNSLVVNETLPKPKMIKNEITPKFIESNYGIEYKTTGGKKRNMDYQKDI